MPFLIGTGAVVLMFLANTVIQYSQQLFRKDVAWSAIAQLLLFSIPTTLKLTLPVGTAIATSLAVSRLTRESELTAMRAAGIPIRRVLLPVMALGLFASALNFFIVERVMPITEARFKDTFRKIAMSPEAIGVRSNVILKFDDGRYHVSIAAIQKGPSGEVMLTNVFVFHHPKRGEYWFMMADDGFYKDELLTLRKPIVYQFEGSRLVQFEVREEQVIHQRFSVDAWFGTPLPDEQTIVELRESIADLKSRGSQDQAREYELEYHSRFAIPFACFVFALFGPIFAIRFSRGGAFVGVLISVIIVVIYYNLWILFGQVLARNHDILPVLVGAWLPNAIFLLAAAVAIWRSE